MRFNDWKPINRCTGTRKWFNILIYDANEVDVLMNVYRLKRIEGYRDCGIM